MKRFTLLIALLLFASSVFAQNTLIDALNDKVIEIEPVSTAEGINNINRFGQLLANNKILALGEETHGVREFGSFRSALIKYLVTNLNYKSIVLEADFSGVKGLNDYVVYNKGQVYNAIIAIGTQIFNTDEYLDLIEWLQAYNKSLPLSDRVRIYGADMQSTLVAINILNGSVKLTKSLSKNALRGLRTLPVGLRQKLSFLQKDTVQMLIKEIKVEISLLPDTSVFRQSLKTLVQSADMILGDFQYDRSRIRDLAMADNISWIYEKDGNRTILLAHNLHIAKNPVYNDVKRAGYYLKEKYGENYYSLGFSFYTGYFLARNEKTGIYQVFFMPETRNKESSEYIFSQVKTPGFLLNFNLATVNKEIDEFLKRKTYSKNIGILYAESAKDTKPAYMPLISKFDGIVFFRTTKAVSLIPVSERVKY